MPKKHSRKVQYHKDNKKRRMRRLMQERLKRLSLSELTFRTCPHSLSNQDESSKVDSTSHASGRKLLKRMPPSNFMQTLQYPLETNCIFTLYGVFSTTFR
jgi:hypothetical protein